MSSSKKIDLSRDFAAGVYLPEAPSPPRLQNQQDSTTLPATHYVYILGFDTGKGGRGEELNQREG
jgi:hypothetical protein